MIPLFAHHLEPQHVPVLAAFLAVGFWLGWHLLSKFLARTSGTGDEHSQPSSPG